jgi:hypothetical protein
MPGLFNPLSIQHQEINMTIDNVRAYSVVLRKFGWAGFTFFLIKGLLWLIAPFVFAWII